jgi:FOG: EAL domain
MTTMLLDDVLRNAGIVSFVQPIFNGEDRVLSGVEVLLRLHNATGYHSPGGFIHDLEESSRINDITCAMIKEVGLAFRDYRHLLPEEFTFSFNLRAQQLKSHRIRSALLAFNALFSGVAILTIEIVERDFIDVDENINAYIKGLRNVGILFAIDDFGAGSSSFRYIEQDIFQSLKLDKEITGCRFAKLEYEHTLTAISGLSYKIGFTVVAEGIETEQQIKELSKLGITTFQGFHLSHPMNITDFITHYLQ